MADASSLFSRSRLSWGQLFFMWLGGGSLTAVLATLAVVMEDVGYSWTGTSLGYWLSVPIIVAVVAVPVLLVGRSFYALAPREERMLMPGDVEREIR